MDCKFCKTKAVSTAVVRRALAGDPMFVVMPVCKDHQDSKYEGVVFAAPGTDECSKWRALTVADALNHERAVATGNIPPGGWMAEVKTAQYEYSVAVSSLKACRFAAREALAKKNQAERRLNDAVHALLLRVTFDEEQNKSKV